MNVKIAPDWQELLAPEFEKPYFAQLVDFVRNEYATQRIYPRGSNIFDAASSTSARSRNSKWSSSAKTPITARGRPTDSVFR